MLTACLVLALMGLLGAFDIAYFHTHTCRLSERPESRVEAWIHVARGFVYAAQFAVVPNLRLGGRFYLAFVALLVADVGIALADVIVEPSSRRSMGGMPPGEYVMHIVLSVLAGVFLHSVASSSAAWWTLPTAVVVEPHAPLALRVVLGAMAGSAAAVAIGETIALLTVAAKPPKPVHVSVTLRAPLARVWALTQDHHLHPAWDHRFSKITMLSERIETGTTMMYEKTILGVTIRGWGRYKLHKEPMQSTFEFGSDDVRSLIRRGVGLWLYRPLADGRVEFATSYTYDVRWGVFGRIVDRFVFRPLIQWETERSFRRLAARYFDEPAARVRGAVGRKPVRARLETV